MGQYIRYYHLFALLAFCTTVRAQLEAPSCQVKERVEYSYPPLQSTIEIRSEKCIPVVVHLVYENEADNLTDIQVYAQIDQLNRDFNLLNENVHRVPSEFRPFMKATGFQFCLVSKTPDGQPTNGITRVKTDSEFIGTSIGPEGRKRIHYDFLGGQSPWYMGEVINIWVGQMESVIGFATFPGEAPFLEEEGIIIDTDYFSPLNNFHSAPNHGHTLTHEMGHFLNLNHIWGDRDLGCSSDDGIDDTPLQEAPYFGCPAHPQMSCDQKNMFMNFMDFTNDNCIAFFTQGQFLRMQESLNSTRSSFRNSNVPLHEPMSILSNFLKDIKGQFSVQKNEILFSGFELTDEPIQAEIFSIDGRLIYQSSFSNQYTYRIDTRNLQANIYIVRLMCKDDIRTFKFFNYY